MSRVCSRSWSTYFSRLLAETFQQQPAIMLGRQNLRPLGVNPSIAHADFVHLIHQLRDEIEAEAGAAEAGDLVFGREDHPRVLDRVLEIVFSHLRRYDRADAQRQPGRARLCRNPIRWAVQIPGLRSGVSS